MYIWLLFVTLNERNETKRFALGYEVIRQGASVGWAYYDFYISRQFFSLANASWPLTTLIRLIKDAPFLLIVF